MQSLPVERCIDLLAYLSAIRNIDRDGGREAGNHRQNLFQRVFVLKRLDLNSLRAHLSSVTLLIDPEIQPRDNFYFPEFLYSPIRCVLAARGDDLGVFIPARLNIYFSAQGEAEKKNVSLRGLTSGGFNAIPPTPPLSTPLTFTRQATQGIMGYILGLSWPSWRPRACVFIS